MPISFVQMPSTLMGVDPMTYQRVLFTSANQRTPLDEIAMEIA